jgi:hypothetical protein
MTTEETLIEELDEEVIKAILASNPCIVVSPVVSTTLCASLFASDGGIITVQSDRGLADLFIRLYNKRFPHQQLQRPDEYPASAVQTSDLMQTFMNSCVEFCCQISSDVDDFYSVRIDLNRQPGHWYPAGRYFKVGVGATPMEAFEDAKKADPTRIEKIGIQ